ncbi:MAG: hypothetical protein IVW57_02050 [Ktedonobacterales bacterium]|nr:hypothetical protein [Ktedonobacterales bacterium]
MDTGPDPRQPTPHADQPTPASRPVAVACPFCRSPDVEPMALFGSHLMTEHYYCRACRTPFERVKDDQGA